MIKVVDIFAGPGGLGEGFSSATSSRGSHAFDVVLSIEMERFAWETLRLRTFFRQFSKGAPDNYYRHLRGEITRDELYRAHKAEAEIATAQCWNTRLGPEGEPSSHVRQRIDAAVGNDKNWVLIGGPPCQAYSLAGRSRNMGNPEYDAHKDVRQKLYVEYLQILADHRPTVFIMENVKGLLSAKVGNIRLFHRILDDLRHPNKALAREGRPIRRGSCGGYHIYSLTGAELTEGGNLESSVIRAEDFGIPQARHRVILLGIRDDLASLTPKALERKTQVSVHDIISKMPVLRSGLSRQKDSPKAWLETLQSQSHAKSNSKPHEANN